MTGKPVKGFGFGGGVGKHSVPRLVVMCPGPQAGVSTDGNPVAVTYPAPTFTGGVAPIILTCSQASGSQFVVGQTIVKVIAKSHDGQTASCSFTVTVTSTAPPPTLVSIAVSGPASGTVGQVLGYSAIGTYSDGSTKNLTSASAWSSSSQAAATINSSGLATLLAAGVSSIRSTVGAIVSNAVSLTVSNPAGSPPGTPTIVAPANGATGVSLTPTLQWSSANAANYDVYFGTSNPPPLVASGLTVPSYSPGTQPPTTQEFWKIVARNANGTTTGPVWSFTTLTPTPPPTLVLTCPANQTATSPDGNPIGVVYPPATVTGGVNPTIAYGIASGSHFQVGVTTVPVTASSDDGQSKSCSFTVTVTKAPPPTLVLTCPPNQSGVSLDGSAVVVNYPPATVTGGVSPSLAYSQNAGTAFPVGTTTVTVTATSQDGQSAVCAFTVTIAVSAPGLSVTCPGNQTAVSLDGKPVTVTYPPATVSGGVSPTLAYSQVSGTAFNVGVTTVTVTATSQDGSTAVCTFTVTVTFTPPPPTGGPAVLTQADLTLMGAFDLPAGQAGSDVYVNGLSVYRNGGVRRFVVSNILTNHLHEFTDPGVSPSKAYPIASFVRTWTNPIYPGGQLNYDNPDLEVLEAFWIDNAVSPPKLYYSYGLSYPSQAPPPPWIEFSIGRASMAVSGGTLTQDAHWGLNQPVSWQQSGFTDIPAWFLSKYGIDPSYRIGVGMGGQWRSITSAGPNATGPTLTAMAPPTGASQVNLTAFKNLLTYPLNTSPGSSPQNGRKLYSHYAVYGDSVAWAWNPIGGVGFYTDNDWLKCGVGTWVDTPNVSGFIVAPTFSSGDLITNLLAFTNWSADGVTISVSSIAHSDGTKARPGDQCSLRIQNGGSGNGYFDRALIVGVSGSGPYTLTIGRHPSGSPLTTPPIVGSGNFLSIGDHYLDGPGGARNVHALQVYAPSDLGSGAPSGAISPASEWFPQFDIDGPGNLDPTGYYQGTYPLPGLYGQFPAWDICGTCYDAQTQEYFVMVRNASNQGVSQASSLCARIFKFKAR